MISSDFLGKEGCGKGSVPGKGPKSMYLGAGLAQVASGACARGLMKAGCP